MSDSLWPHGLYSPWNFPGQNTGVGSRSLLEEIFPTQGSNCLLHCTQILYQLSHKGNPSILKWVACPFSSRSSWPRNLLIQVLLHCRRILYQLSYWSGLTFPSPGDLPDPGIKHTPLSSPVLEGRFLSLHHLGSPLFILESNKIEQWRGLHGCVFSWTRLSRIASILGIISQDGNEPPIH